MKPIIVLSIALVLSSCAGRPVIPAAVQVEAERPLTCEGKDQCDLFWQRAQFYVNKYSAFKLQLVNDSLIQTYSPSGGSPSLGYNISREPTHSGSSRIWVKLWCDNMFGCYPEIVPEQAKFKTYVRTGR